MGVLIGIDPHKATNAVAAIDERGQLLEYAVFSTNRAGPRSLARWALSASRLAAGRWRALAAWDVPSPSTWSPPERWS